MRRTVGVGLYEYMRSLAFYFSTAAPLLFPETLNHFLLASGTMEALRQLPRTQPPLVASVGAVCLLAVLLLLYRAALPKPLKGIPYNHHAAKRILGDIPDALAWHKSRSELFTFISAQVVKLDSPIIQLFMRPFGRPCES